MEETQTPAVGIRRLFDRLQLEQGEPGLFSLALVHDTGQWRLRAGSLLFGPPEMSRVAWTDWAVRETGRSHFGGVYGIRAGYPSTFSLNLAPWRLIRFALPQAVALDRLIRWVETGVLEDGAGIGEHVHTALGMPGAPGVVLHSSSGRAGQLCASASRPVTGWLHPGSDSVATDLPSDWQVVPQAPRCDAVHLLLGLSSMDGQPRGLLVGRLARTAWIADMRATPPRLDDFTVTVGLDPGRQSLWDLVLDLEECDRDGHLLTARRLRLADLPLPAAGMTRYDVTFPSSGKGLTRNVRLYGLNGQLLDGHDALRLAESIVATFYVEGDQDAAATVHVGDARPPSLTQRLDDLDKSDRAYADMLRAGLSSRIIVNRSGGSRALAQRLTAARGELRILDPYFGAMGTNWDVLDDVTIPIRILTTSDRFQPPPLGTAPHAPAIHIRQVERRRSIFHDRSYTWAGGGVSVGASANGLDGTALYLMDVLDPVVVVGLSSHFDTWWATAADLWRRP